MKFSSHLGKGSWAIASRGLVVLYGGVTVAVMAVIPKEQFGTLGLFQAIFGMLFTFSDNFAFQAIVKFGVEPETDLQELISSTTSLFLGFAALVLAAMFIASAPLAALLKNPNLPSLLPSLALLVVVTGPRVVASKVLQMRFRMRELFFVDFANFGLASILIVVALITKRINGAQDVITITIISGLASALLGLLLARKEVKIQPKFSRKTYQKIFEFVRYQSGMGVVSVLQQQADTLLVSGFTGPLGVAAYAGAKNFYRGFEVIRDTSVLFIFPASSKYHSRGEIATLRRILEKAVGFLYLLLLPLGALMILVAPFLYHLIYHNKYDSSIPIFQVLCLASLVLPLQIVLSTAMSGTGEVKAAFRITVIAYALNLTLALILLPTIGIIGAAIAFIAGTACQGILNYRHISKTVGFNSKHLLRRAFKDAWSFLRDKLKIEN